MSEHRTAPTSALRRFLASGAAGGVVLMLATVLALVASNTEWSDAYESFRSMTVTVAIGRWLELEKPLLLWVNDLWMAIFFLLVGLEIKRELFEGELASRSQALLPVVAALGGMIVPALIYCALNRSDADALRGWAIPSATDIAFALGIVLLLGPRVPVSLRVFLTAVAIIDDLGAIAVIAAFYTHELLLGMLAAAGTGAALLFVLNRARVARLDVYLVVGLALWVCVLKSGVHATLAGVVTAFAIPLRTADGDSPLRRLEHGLHPWVTFVVLPMFAFINAGVSLEGVSWETLIAPVPLGIALGLVVGKTIGVGGASWLLVRRGVARLPAGATGRQFLGVCVLCGVGFTMSLFIGALAFEGMAEEYGAPLRLGVLGGSLVAGTLGTLILLTSAQARTSAPS
jgi:NhaA family Na+:H+ antiporter